MKLVLFCVVPWSLCCPGTRHKKFPTLKPGIIISTLKFPLQKNVYHCLLQLLSRFSTLIIKHLWYESSRFLEPFNTIHRDDTRVQKKVGSRLRLGIFFWAMYSFHQ